MKYIVLITVIALIIFVKPWDISIAGVNKSAKQDSTLIPPLSELPISLLPINQVTNNTDSELPETERLDRTIEQFMNKWEIKGASFALMKDNRLIYCKDTVLPMLRHKSRWTSNIFSALLRFPN